MATLKGGRHKVLKRQGARNCLNMDTFQISSPVGTWEVEQCNLGVHLVKLKQGEYPEIDLEIPVRNLNKCSPALYTEQWLDAYFNRLDECMSMKLPTVCPYILDPQQSFRSKVWDYIYSKLGVGELASYGEVAAAVGSSKAAQAVGTAMKMNPVSLIIPCHRVTRVGGDPGHYSGGTRDNLKVQL
ncbi:methylated-DNA--protein-cysteine methyltransferase isoform X2 [Eurytemora carolleeae]|uniref:methylated-DNA--protein-cysteine methyltransferase isoform X2 n=1 Tax=Eurytemora carolleeae TaxID=1294199 RepID=UPI000C78D380|nr:methylated-DNA--protein-cysteine methyltransferase isoform X2 [Eurytemora carolleeae]|eukprot:XP_023346267.1 methylated-DNA--protein-cysteine methyltransferase-like isoform X2 [Eurytemora affinis]